MKDRSVPTRCVGVCWLLAAVAVCALARPAGAQDDAAFLQELQKQGFVDIALQFSKDHPGVGATAAGREKLDLLQAELNNRNTTPERRAKVAAEAIALAREMLKAEPPRGDTPEAAKKQLAHASLRVFLGRLLLGQIHALFQNAILVGLGRDDRQRFARQADEALKALAPAADTITRVIGVMENDDEFDKHWGEQLYLKTISDRNVARYLTARAKLYVAWSLPADTPQHLPAADQARIQQQVDRRLKLLQEAAQEMEYWTRQPEKSGVKFESLYLLGVIRWQQRDFAKAEGRLTAATVETAPVVIQFMARAALIRTMLDNKQFTKALQAAADAIQWTGKNREQLGPNAEALMVLLKSDITLSQASLAFRRGEMAEYKRLKQAALAELVKYVIAKPDLKASLYQNYVQRLLDDARAAAKIAGPKPELLRPDGPATQPGRGPEPSGPPSGQPATQPAGPQEPTVEDDEADILPKPATLEPFELAALGAVMLGEKRYDAARYYLEALVARKDAAAKPFLNEGFFNRGIALYELGRDAEAADSFVELAGRDPAYPRALDGIAYAVNIYIGLLRKDATQVSVREKLERALKLLMEDLPASQEQIRKTAEWRFTRGDNLRHLKKFIEAVAQFENVPATDPQYYEARYDIARSCHNYVEQLKEQKAPAALMRSACRDAIDRAKKFLLYVDAEIAKLKGTPAGDEIEPGSTTGLTRLNSKINDKGQAELRIVDLLVNMTPPGPGETKEDLLRTAVPMLEAFPEKYPAKPQRELVAQALGMLAEVWLTLGKIENAVKVVDDFKKRYPKEASGLIRLILDALLNEVERLRKAGLLEQARNKAIVAVRLVESQISWVEDFEEDPVQKRKGLYDLRQLAASLYREAEQHDKAIKNYGQLIVDRQRQMVEGMVDFIQTDCTHNPGLIKDALDSQKQYVDEATKQEKEGKWHEAASILENLRDNLWQWTNADFNRRGKKLPAAFNDLPDDATNYKGMALAYMALKDYDNAKRRWWKLANTLRGPDQPGGDVTEKEQWWEAFYNGIRCDLLQNKKDSFALHKLRIDITEKNHPDLGGLNWKPKILQLRRDIIKAMS